MGRPEFLAVIDEICVRRGWQCSKLSSDWILRIADVNKFTHTNIFGYVFDINNAASAEICKEKAATAQVLQSEGLPIIEHEVFLSSTMKQMAGYVPESGVWPRLVEYAKKCDYNMVVKPLKGTGGNGVYKITCQRDLEEAAHDIFSVDYGLAACEFVDIEDEYRVIWLDRARLVYRKVRASVVGDGVSTVQQLASKYLAGANSEKIAEIAIAIAEGPLSSTEKAVSVPKKGEIVSLQWKHNLGHGAQAEVLSEKDGCYRDIVGLARAAVQSIGMKFCSVDIVATGKDEYKVMEVNCGVMMDSAIVQCADGFELATMIYEEALEAALVNEERQMATPARAGTMATMFT